MTDQSIARPAETRAEFAAGPPSSDQPPQLARLHLLEEANRELEAFSYSVSHDLRAPLRAIDGLSRILEHEHGHRLDEEGRRYVALVRQNAEAMGRLLDGLLALSRLGHHELQLRPLDMTALAAEAAAELEAERAETGATVAVGELPAAAGDPVLVKQVFVNLLGNAIKFSRGSTPPIVEVGAHRGPDGPVFFVRDNGVGFDPRHADRLFGLFQRLHPADEFEGTGVGLATVQRIVHRHGGRIWAAAEPGGGATFSFTLGGAPDA